MTFKDKIVQAMFNQPPMTARGVGNLIDMDGGVASKHLSAMVKNGYVFECGTRHGRKLYSLTNKRQSLPRGTVKSYIEANPGQTIQQIADGIPCRNNTVNEYIRNAIRDGAVSRAVNSRGECTYSIVEKAQMPFGCANPLTALFNNRLAKVRKNKTNLLQ